MRFYKSCTDVAKSIGALLNEEQMAAFVETDFDHLWEYQLTIGMWIRNHLLPHNAYLRQALLILDYVTPNEMSLFLIEFAQKYWKLERAEMT